MSRHSNHGDLMDAKRMGVGTVVGGIAVYALGWVIFQKAFASFYAANAGSATGVNRESNIVWAMALGSLAYAALITYVMTLRGGPVSVMNGAKAGALVGFLIWLTVDMIFYGSTNLNQVANALVDPVLEAVRGGVTGAVIASVLSRYPGHPA